MPIKYIPFIPEPVEGQAVLRNFNRILKYKGADDVAMTIKRGMPLYEMKKQETVGENTENNMVIRGECVSACAYLKEKGIQVDLVYIDPPFASGADYAKKVYVRRNPKVAETIKKAEQELDIEEFKAFEEKMYGDVWDKEKYLNWMYENLMAIKSVMSETASIYVHLDWHIGHYVKILLDEIFGEEKFLNEIIWCYKERESSKNYYNRKHDTIYFYSKSDEYIFNYKAIWEEYSAVTLKKFKFTDENGEKYRLRYKDGRNDPTEESCDTYRQYLKDAAGTLPRDWFEMGIVNQAATEREDYATPKPQALLERFIKASTNKNMLVADFFGGSGVAAVAANKLGRRFIHCDIGINSIQVARDRLKTDGAEFDVLEINDGVQLYRNPVQTMDKLKSLIPGLKNEASLGSFWQGAISDSKYGLVPVYIPNLADGSSKLLDKVMINRIIHQAIPELDSSIKKVRVYYVDITDKSEIEQFIKEDDSTNLEIELSDLKVVLDDVVIGDHVEFHTEKLTEEPDSGYSVIIDKFLSDRVIMKIKEFNEKAKVVSYLNRKEKQIEISENGLELVEFLSVDCTADSGEWHSDSEIKIDKNGFVIVNGSKTKNFWDAAIRCEKKPLRLKIRNICGDETICRIKD